MAVRQHYHLATTGKPGQGDSAKGKTLKDSGPSGASDSRRGTPPKIRPHRRGK